MRLGVSLIGCGLLVLGVTASSPAATPNAVADDPMITVSYEGTLEAFSEPFGDHPRGPDHHEAHYRWTLVWKGRQSKLEQNAAYRFDTKELGGTVTYVDRVQLPAVKGPDRNDCKGEFSAKPGAKVPVVVTLNPDNRKGFGVQLTRPVSDTYLVSSNRKSNYDLCTRVFAGLLPSKSQVVSPFFYFGPSGGTRPNRIRSTQTLPPNERFRTAIDETVTVTVGGKTSPPATGAGDTNAKLAARDDLRRALERAKGPCLHLAISLGVITTGAVWSAVGAPIPGGIPAGGSVIATGAVMTQAVVPLCTEHVKQIIVSYSIYKRDPPAPRAVIALKLPSCTRWEAKVRAYCTELSVAVTKLVIAERKVFPALVGLQSAAAKLTSARRKGDEQAVKAAQAKVNKAVASLRAARSTSSAAGKKVAHIVRSAGVQGRLTKQQSVAVVDALLAELQKRGVPASDLQKVAPAVLRPAATDVLAALGA